MPKPFTAAILASKTAGNLANVGPEPEQTSRRDLDHPSLAPDVGPAESEVAMTQITLPHGIFLPPFHPMEELQMETIANYSCVRS